MKFKTLVAAIAVVTASSVHAFWDDSDTSGYGNTDWRGYGDGYGTGYGDGRARGTGRPRMRRARLAAGGPTPDRA